MSQTAHTTLGKKHQFRINSNGSLGIDITNLKPASFEDGDPSKPYIGQAGLWISVQDELNNYHTAVQYLSAEDSFDFWPGPIDTLTGQTGDITTWDKVWKVTQLEIDNHKANFNSGEYIIPASILNWPAQGSGGFSKFLAPFVDVNKNKTYDPEYGDYPAIKGIEAAYTIFNDLADEHTSSFGQDIGIEVQLMAYTLASSSKIFLEYFIINRSSTDYTNAKIGFFIDGKCGNKRDNYAGTLETYPQTVFVYNADSLDEGFFENQRPYVLASFLNENLSSSICFNDKTGINGSPEINQDFINYSIGKWKNSTDLVVGGDGTGPGVSTSIIFPQSDESKPLFWPEELSSNDSGSRTIMGFASFSLFNAGDYKKMDIAIDVGTVNSLQNIRDSIREKSSTSLSYFKEISSSKRGPIQPYFGIYPNPSNGTFTITNVPTGSEFFITNNQGVKVFYEKRLQESKILCNIKLSPGIYWVELITEQNTRVKKLCITQ
ncbi:MAG: hypothetical protein COA58_15675 [Bacteroidetes bacterium]|nr:MAG: hypothetical protein COA58_15675 [Bacteroidota bacterium]